MDMGNSCVFGSAPPAFVTEVIPTGSCVSHASRLGAYPLALGSPLGPNCLRAEQKGPELMLRAFVFVGSFLSRALAPEAVEEAQEAEAGMRRSQAQPTRPGTSVSREVGEEAVAVAAAVAVVAAVQQAPRSYR